MYQQVFHWVGGMKFQHEILIPWAGSELGHLFGFFDDHPGDVIVRSSMHVTNSNWTKNLLQTSWSEHCHSDQDNLSDNTNFSHKLTRCKIIVFGQLTQMTIL